MKTLLNYIGGIVGIIIGGIGFMILAALVILLSPIIALFTL